MCSPSVVHITEENSILIDLSISHTVEEFPGKTRVLWPHTNGEAATALPTASFANAEHSDCYSTYSDRMPFQDADLMISYSLRKLFPLMPFMWGHRTLFRERPPQEG